MCVLHLNMLHCFPYKCYHRQTEPSNLCSVDYTFDTRLDKTLYQAQAVRLIHILTVFLILNGLLQVFETLFQEHPEFNKGKTPRRTWQPSSGTYQTRYVASSMLFDKPWKHRGLQPEALAYPLHPWIKRAVGDWKAWIPNPLRPQVLVMNGNELVNLSQAQRPTMSRGDMVWLSFVVQVYFNESSWGPTFVPLDIIRVGTAPPELIRHRDGASAGSDVVQLE